MKYDMAAIAPYEASYIIRIGNTATLFRTVHILRAVKITNNELLYIMERAVQISDRVALVPAPENPLAKLKTTF